MHKTKQLDLFQADQNLNIMPDLKRRIRIAMSETSLSRDEIADAMNALARRDGIDRRLTRAVLDSWCKESGPGRVPGIADLVLFCHVLDTLEPLRAIARPLGGYVIGAEAMQVLTWGRAEMERRKAARRARVALELIET